MRTHTSSHTRALIPTRVYTEDTPRNLSVSVHIELIPPFLLYACRYQAINNLTILASKAALSCPNAGFHVVLDNAVQARRTIVPP